MHTYFSSLLPCCQHRTPMSVETNVSSIFDIFILIFDKLSCKSLKVLKQKLIGNGHNNMYPCVCLTASFIFNLASPVKRHRNKHTHLSKQYSKHIDKRVHMHIQGNKCIDDAIGMGLAKPLVWGSTPVFHQTITGLGFK